MASSLAEEVLAKRVGAMTSKPEKPDSGLDFDPLGRLQMLWYITDRYSLELLHSAGMANLLKDYGIVYADTEIDGTFVSDLDAEAVKSIRSLLKRHGE